MSARLSTEVAIIGGGIVGASAALFLRRRGVPVVLLDADRCGSRASGVNYGGVRRQGRALAQMPLTRRAHELWNDLPHLIGTDGEFVRSGHLKLARNEADMAALAAYRDQTRGFGMNLELVTGTAFRARFPWLADRVIGGSFCPQDGHANPRLVTPAIARRARELGADIREHNAVTHVAHDGNRFVLRVGDTLEVTARTVLNCAGAWGRQFAEQFGEIVPETVIRPLMMVTEPLPVFMTASLGIQGGGIYARQIDRGNCIIGGGRVADNTSTYARPSSAAMHALMAATAALLPRLRHASVIRFWSGIEGNMPDHNPVLGPSLTTPNLFHAFGFSGAGFQIGPAVGEVLASLAATGATDIPIDAFGIARFTAPARPSVEPSLPVGHTLEST